MPATNSPREMRVERAGLIQKARDIAERANSENRQLKAEDRAEIDRLFAAADELEANYTALEQLADREAKLGAPAGRISPPEQPRARPDQLSERVDPRSTDEYLSAYDRYLRGDYSQVEKLALAADADTSGGYLTGTKTMAGLLKALDDKVSIRALATKIQVGAAASVGVPSLDADPADADWTGEILTGSEDSTMKFGKRELVPHPLAKRIKVSNKLLRIANQSISDLVTQRLSYKFAVSEEKAFLTGDGVKKPLGLFTASNDGISTSRDVSTDNTTTAITADGLINAKYALKQGYQDAASTRWLFHRDAMKMIRKLKDSQNQYLWVPGLQVGQADRILDVPVVQSEYVPNTFTTGLYVGLIGDLSYYWIADALEFSIQRLFELYAETNQTGYIGRLECDGMPALAEAFARVKLA